MAMEKDKMDIASIYGEPYTEPEPCEPLSADEVKAVLNDDGVAFYAKG